MKGRREVVRANLLLAFPEKSSKDRESIGRRSHHNLVTVFLEMLSIRHLSRKAIGRHLRVENIELIKVLPPEGALLLSAHLGNWELLAFGAAALAEMSFSIIVKEQNDYGELTRMRTARGNTLITTAHGARQASNILRTGGVVAMLADQAASSPDPLVDMFGLATHTFGAPARLALRFRPRVVVGYAVRTPSGEYVARLEELHHNDLPDTPEGAWELTQRYVRQLEGTVRAHPDQWLWQHRKWKNTPGVEYPHR